MKRWTATKDGEVVHGFDAEQSYIDDYLDRVVNARGFVTPPWWDETVVFHDVTHLETRPVLGFYKAANGHWVDGNAYLTVDRQSIPADGTTFALVTFEQKGPNAPAEIAFDVNGQVVIETLGSAKSASLEITSRNPGDRITVRALDLAVTIVVED